MRRIILMGIGVLFLVSCAQASPLPVRPTAIPLPPVDTPSPTQTAVPTETSTVTATPTVGFIPPAIEPVAISPSALNETNAGTQMKLLGLLGTGRPTDLAWSPAGDLFAVSTTLGLYLFDQGGLGEAAFFGLDIFKIDGPITELAFSPDGQLLALAGGGEISLCSLAGRRVQKVGAINADKLDIFELAWGKAGQIAALSFFTGGYLDTLVVWEAATGREIFSEQDTSSPPPAFSPDGTLLAFGTDKGLKVVEAKTGQLIARKSAYPQSIGFTPAGDRLVIINEPQKGSDLSWDFSLDQQEPFSDCPSPLAWSASRLLCGQESDVFFIDLVTGKPAAPVPIKPANYGTAVRPDGVLIAMLDFNNDIHLFNAADGSQARFIPMGSFDAYAENKDVAVGIVTLQKRSVELIATVDHAGDICLWTLAEARHLLTTLKNGARVTGLAFSPDQRTLASLDANGLLRFWDIPVALESGPDPASPSLKFELASSLFPAGRVTGPIAFSPAGTHLVLFADSDKYLLDLQSRSYQRIGSANLANPEGTRIFFTPEGGLLDYSLNQGTFSLVNAVTNEIIIPSLDLHENAGFGGYSSEVEASAISPDGTLFAYATQEGILNILDLSTRKWLNSFQSHPKMTTMANVRSVSSLAFSPRSNLLVTVGADNTTRLWNIRAGVELRRLNVCCYAAFTPSGRYLITAGSGVIRIWGITEQ